MADSRLFDAGEMAVPHTVFRREFGLARPLVSCVTVGDTERSAIVAAHLGFITAALHHHHSFEDELVWPRLMDRDPQTKNLGHLQDVIQQHEQLETAVSGVTKAATAWSRDASAGSRTDLADALDCLLPLLLEHMAFEEMHVVPVMERHITAAEWNLLIQALGADIDGVNLPLLFGMNMYEGDPDIVDAAIANMPANLRPVIRQTAAHAYEQHAELIYGTRKPPRSTDL
jgi:hemerythrin-like domain-containing protein